tara:strand:+ start:11718 stop:12968 length:1251 start_codon:yes stop_codon:yes gene_type:complete
MTPRKFLLILFTFGLLTELRIFQGEQVIIPVVISFVIGWIFVLIHLPKFFNRDLSPFYMLILFFMTSIFFGPDKFESLLMRERFLGFIQISTSLVIGLAIFFESKKYSLKFLSSFFMALFCFLFIGAFIEVFTPFKILLDSIMEPLFPNYYSNTPGADSWLNDRDKSLYFLYRPKFFTSEPSHLGKFISMTLFLWRISTNHKSKNNIFLLLLMMSFFLVRSPLILFMIPVYFLIIFVLEKSQNKSINLNRLFGSILLFLALIVGSANFLQSRLNLASFGMDSSLNQRLIIPSFITYEVLGSYPFFGVGISAKEATELIVLEAFQEIDPNFQPRSLKQLLDKNHASSLMYLIYFGLIGTFIIIFLFRNLILSFGVNNWLFIILVFAVLGFTHGKLTGLNTWVYFFVTCRLMITDKKI